MADMQARARGVEADIGRDRSLEGELVQPLRVRDLVDIAALRQELQKGGTIRGHGLRALV
jgi:hypothetical protein